MRSYTNKSRRFANDYACVASTISVLFCGCALPSQGEPADESLGDIAQGLSTFTVLGFPLNELPVEIKNVNSGRCLDVAGASASAGANVQQFGCTGGANQTWFLSASGPDTFQIRPGHTGNKNLDIAGGSLADQANVQIYDPVTNAQVFGLLRQPDGNFEIISVNSNKCLDVENASTADYANVQQYTCHGGPNQRWQLTVRPQGMHLIAKHSGRCVDVAGAGTGNNVNVQQYDCLKQTNQKWTIGSTTVANGQSYVTLVAGHSGLCLDVAGASLADNANVQQYACTGGDNQQWLVTEQSDGYVTIVNKQSGKCLDVAAASAANNANIQQFTCTGGDNQRFYWSTYDSRHVQVVQAAQSSGADRLIQSNAAIDQQVAWVNTVYGRYGLRLVYDAAVDKSNVDNDAIFNLGDDVTQFVCPDGSVGTSGVCAARYAANWPDKVVVFSRPGNGFASGDAKYITIGQMGSNATLVCGNVPDTKWLAHEFGHYSGLTHTFAFNGDDLLSDTRLDPSGPACLAPNTPTGVFGGAIVDTDNVMSYYYNTNVRISRMQASLTRANAYARGY